MTEEMAIKVLREEQEWVWSLNVNSAFDLAIAALSKQISKKPIKTELGGYYCPCCRGIFDRTIRFCDICGQAIEWSEKE